MQLGLKDKVLLITGGAKGIGEAIALDCAAEGAIPAIADQDADACELVKSELARRGQRSLSICCDLRAPEECQKAVRLTLQELGKIDGLINNAGVNDRIGLEEGGPEQFVGSLSRNLLHYYNMAHFALPALKQSKGSIVNVASKTAVTGQGGTSGYAASKGAILALTREWAVELLAYEIRVNAVVPAEVMTPLYQSWLATFPEPQEKLRRIISQIPLGNRMTRPEEIASMVLFLLSDRARHITGQHLFVDGGYVHLDRAACS